MELSHQYVTFGVLTNCFIEYDNMLDKAYSHYEASWWNKRVYLRI
jgi:hypothetical protein